MSGNSVQVVAIEPNYMHTTTINKQHWIPLTQSKTVESQ